MSNENEKVSRYYHMPLIYITIITGLVAGITGTIFSYAGFYFHFSEIDPDLILKIWRGDWTNGWMGKIVAAISYGILSIFVALLYYILFKKRPTLVWGAGFGIGIFVIVFFLLPFVVPGIKSIGKYESLTIISGFCHFLLYGTFIGYSISYEYSERQNMKETEKQA